VQWVRNEWLDKCHELVNSLVIFMFMRMVSGPRTAHVSGSGRFTVFLVGSGHKIRPTCNSVVPAHTGCPGKGRNRGCYYNRQFVDEKTLYSIAYWTRVSVNLKCYTLQDDPINNCWHQLRVASTYTGYDLVVAGVVAQKKKQKKILNLRVFLRLTEGKQFPAPPPPPPPPSSSAAAAAALSSTSSSS